VSELDFAIRKKDLPKATAKLAAVKASLDAVLAKIM
jgi:hypothetical protein